MNKYLIYILFFTSLSFSQEQHHINFYGEIGFGVSNSNFPSHNSGINSNLSASIGNNNWLMRLTHKVNGIFSFTYPKDKVRSTSLLIGRSISLYTEFNSMNENSLEWNIIFYTGLSAVENQSNVVSVINGNSQTHLRIEDGIGIPIELELQYLIPKYRGVALNLFYNVNKFRDFYGLSLSVVIGYF
jgi:hypothetical protein